MVRTRSTTPRRSGRSDAAPGTPQEASASAKKPRRTPLGDLSPPASSSASKSRRSDDTTNKASSAKRPRVQGSATQMQQTNGNMPALICSATPPASSPQRQDARADYRNDVSSREISRSVSRWFGDCVPSDCVSARVFALYMLSRVGESSPPPLPPPGNEEEPVSSVSGARPDGSGSTAQSHNSPIHLLLPLLGALVEVESVVSRDLARSCDSSAVVSDGGDTVNKEQCRKKVGFCTFDCSATAPRNDRVPGSEFHQQDAIEALIKAKERLDGSVLAGSQQRKEEFLAEATAVAAFLQHLEKQESLLRACARAVGPNYPEQRIARCCSMYSREFHTLIGRLERGGKAGALLLERRLAEFVGQAVRCDLRILLNDAPARLSPSDTEYEDRALKYSSVLELIDLDEPTDRDLSCLVSIALQFLCELFSVESLLTSQLRVPTSFCSSLASQQTIDAKLKVLQPLENVGDIDNDIHDATAFLAAAKACQFLVELFSIPSVQEEIERCGGWDLIETHATTIWKFDLWMLCPLDKHLMLLSNFSTLFDKLKLVLPSMLDEVPEAEFALQELEKRLRLKTRLKAVTKAHPCTLEFKKTLQEGRRRAEIFPRVAESKYLKSEESDPAEVPQYDIGDDVPSEGEDDDEYVDGE